MENEEKAFVIRALRRASLRWPARTKAKQAARVGRNRYQCADCGQIVPNKSISIDHRLCVVDPETGWQSWDVFIQRLFCGEDNLSAVCRACHGEKTKQENARRREIAKANKPKPTRRKRKNKKENGAGPGTLSK